MSDKNKPGAPPIFSVPSRSLCICKKCGKQFRSLMNATNCCLGLNTQRTIVSLGEPCSDARDNSVPASITETVQHQLSLKGSGDFCRLGCCDFSQKFEKNRCNREKRT